MEHCRWCRRPFAVEEGRTGRPRRFCRRSCRQRDYESRRRAAELGLDEAELVMARRDVDALKDQLYVLAAAVEDVDRDLAESSEPEDVAGALEWLLEAVRPLVTQLTVRPPT